MFRVRCTNAGSGSGNFFALKRMYVNNDTDLAVCKREIQILSSLTHKNIIGYVDSNISPLPDGVYEIFLLMVYCPGSVVSQMNEAFHQGRYFSEPLVLRIFTDTCEAVSRLHHCHTPVIHRDLKVENLLLDSRTGNYVLCDFGSATARVLSPAQLGVSKVGEEISKYTTLAYRAPEMVDLYSKRPITTKADMWALGCLLYKLCYFQTPFGESSLAIQAAQLSTPNKPVYSAELRSLIRYLLQSDPDLRPDIYQAAALAFKLRGLPCAVQNLSRASVPVDWQTLPRPRTEPESQLAPFPINSANMSLSR